MTPAAIFARASQRVTVTEQGCHLWQGATCSKGYAHVKVGKQTVLLHRLAVIVRDGSIPGGQTVDHMCHRADQCSGGRSCSHRRCINPAHLAVTTRLANQLRAVAERRAVA